MFYIKYTYKYFWLWESRAGIKLAYQIREKNRKINNGIIVSMSCLTEQQNYSWGHLVGFLIFLYCSRPSYVIRNVFVFISLSHKLLKLSDAHTRIFLFLCMLNCLLFSVFLSECWWLLLYSVHFNAFCFVVFICVLVHTQQNTITKVIRLKPEIVNGLVNSKETERVREIKWKWEWERRRICLEECRFIIIIVLLLFFVFISLKHFVLLYK